MGFVCSQEFSIFLPLCPHLRCGHAVAAVPIARTNFEYAQPDEGAALSIGGLPSTVAVEPTLSCSAGTRRLPQPGCFLAGAGYSQENRSA
jgi:hypothetical protein